MTYKEMEKLNNLSKKKTRARLGHGEKENIWFITVKNQPLRRTSLVEIKSIIESSTYYITNLSILRGVNL